MRTSSAICEVLETQNTRETADHVSYFNEFIEIKVEATQHITVNMPLVHCTIINHGLAETFTRQLPQPLMES